MQGDQRLEGSPSDVQTISPEQTGYRHRHSIRSVNDHSRIERTAA